MKSPLKIPLFLKFLLKSYLGHGPLWLCFSLVHKLLLDGTHCYVLECLNYLFFLQKDLPLVLAGRYIVCRIYLIFFQNCLQAFWRKVRVAFILDDLLRCTMPQPCSKGPAGCPPQVSCVRLAASLHSPSVVCVCAVCVCSSGFAWTLGAPLHICGAPSLCSSFLARNSSQLNPFQILLPVLASASLPCSAWNLVSCPWVQALCSFFLPSGHS